VLPEGWDSAAADFKQRVEDFKNTHLDGVAFSDGQHDVVRTNSITSPLKAQVTVKKTVNLDAGQSAYQVTIYALSRRGNSTTTE
jgi:hypothetical protein